MNPAVCLHASNMKLAKKLSQFSGLRNSALRHYDGLNPLYARFLNLFFPPLKAVPGYRDPQL